jgi:hypothetical protein
MAEETDKAYRAFVHYRDMGHKRSLLQVTLDLYPTDTRVQLAESARVNGYDSNAVSSQLAGYSSRYNWRERVRAWDDNLLKQRELVIIDSLRHEATSSIERDQTLRSNRDALAQRLRSKLTTLAQSTVLDATQAKAHRELVLAVERLQIVEDGCDKGLADLKAHITAKAIPQASQSDLPPTIPAETAAAVLALLSAVAND